MLVVARPKRWAKVVRFPAEIPAELRGGVVTLGNFDGVHLGHNTLLAEMERVRGNKAKVVVSFYPHPASVVRGASAITPITGLREKLAVLSQAGIELLYLIHFTTELSKLSAHEFIEQVLLEKLALSHLVVGEDAAVGRGREGDVHFLRTTLEQRGVGVSVVPHLVREDVKPSSRYIRTLLTEGKVSEATELLGRFHTVVGRVVHGVGRGSSIGIPTANVHVGERLLPAHGVYACIATYHGVQYPAVANIGVRPTFEHGAEVTPTLEVFVMNRDGTKASLAIYGKRITVSFVARVRGEMKFPAVDALVTQIRSDAQGALQIVSPFLEQEAEIVSSQGDDTIFE